MLETADGLTPITTKSHPGNPRLTSRTLEQSSICLKPRSTQERPGARTNAFCADAPRSFSHQYTLSTPVCCGCIIPRIWYTCVRRTTWFDGDCCIDTTSDTIANTVSTTGNSLTTRAITSTRSTTACCNDLNLRYQHRYHSERPRLGSTFICMYCSARYHLSGILTLAHSFCFLLLGIFWRCSYCLRFLVNLCSRVL
jgi:hypothetical protein